MKIGNVYADIDKNFFKLPHELNNNYIENISFKGGALIDSENSGKHKCMVIYCQNNTPLNYIDFKNFNINKYKYNNHYLKINCNLIITDFNNFDKWKTYLNNYAEFEKIIYINNKNSIDKIKYYDIMNCKYVIVSTKFIANENQYDELCENLYFNELNIKDNIHCLATEYFRNFNFISKKSPLLSHFHWHMNNI